MKKLSNVKFKFKFLIVGLMFFNLACEIDEGPNIENEDQYMDTEEMTHPATAENANPLPLYPELADVQSQTEVAPDEDINQAMEMMADQLSRWDAERVGEQKGDLFEGAKALDLVVEIVLDTNPAHTRWTREVAFCKTSSDCIEVPVSFRPINGNRRHYCGRASWADVNLTELHKLPIFGNRAYWDSMYLKNHGGSTVLDIDSLVTRVYYSDVAMSSYTSTTDDDPSNDDDVCTYFTNRQQYNNFPDFFWNPAIKSITDRRLDAPSGSVWMRDYRTQHLFEMMTHFENLIDWFEFHDRDINNYPTRGIRFDIGKSGTDFNKYGGIPPTQGGCDETATWYFNHYWWSSENDWWDHDQEFPPPGHGGPEGLGLIFEAHNRLYRWDGYTLGGVDNSFCPDGPGFYKWIRTGEWISQGEYDCSQKYTPKSGDYIQKGHNGHSAIILAWYTQHTQAGAQPWDGALALSGATIFTQFVPVEYTQYTSNNTYPMYVGRW